MPRDLPVVQVQSLTKVYGAGEEKRIILQGLNLTVRRGDMCCIFGVPASGKSVLFNQLAGMEYPTWGQIQIGGVSVADLNEEGMALFRQRHMGLVFQDDNLMPELTVAENVTMPLMFWGMGTSERRKAARAMICQAGLQYNMDRLPGQLSGEMRRRVSIARAFVTRPDVILADEPAAGLNPDQAEKILKLIRELAEHYRQTVVLFSRDPAIKYYGDCFGVLSNGEIIDEEKGSDC